MNLELDVGDHCGKQLSGAEETQGRGCEYYQSEAGRSPQGSELRPEGGW